MFSIMLQILTLGPLNFFLHHAANTILGPITFIKHSVAYAIFLFVYSCAAFLYVGNHRIFTYKLSFGITGCLFFIYFSDTKVHGLVKAEVLLCSWYSICRQEIRSFILSIYPFSKFWKCLQIVIYLPFL